MDLLLNTTTHDLVFQNGPLTSEYTTQPFTQVVAQRLKIRLLCFEGEWFMDTEYGVPYFQSILAKKVPKSRVDSILQQEILAERGVKEIVSFTSSLQNRQYSASFRVKVSTGETTDVITITPTS